MTQRVDIAIIGGGVVGASLAFGMRAGGARIAVLDAGDAAAPSRNNFGLVWLQGKGRGAAAYAAWTLESVAAWAAFARTLDDDTGIDVGLEQSGGLHVCETITAVDARRRAFDSLFAEPRMPRYDVQWLDAAALRDMWPWQGGDAAGASYCPLDGHCDFRALALALSRACTTAGIDGIVGRVDRIEPMHPAFRLTGHGVAVDADRIVIAAGLDSSRLGAMVDLDVPLRPVKGHVLALDVARRMRWPAETLRSTRDGRLLVGDSHEERGDTALDAAVLAAIAQRTLRVAPCLAAAPLATAWAACRVMSPDGLPIYAQSARHPGAFVVATHSGVTLAAAHANMLAPALLAGHLPQRLSCFDASRFGASRRTIVPPARTMPAPLPAALERSTLADVARWPTTSDAVRAVCRDDS